MVQSSMFSGSKAARRRAIIVAFFIREETNMK